MFAGEKSKPAADASYRYLLWENFYVDRRFNIGTKIQSNKEIGTINIWGPFLRVSFDLIIRSLSQDEWSNVLAFATSETYYHETGKIIHLPILYLHRSGFLQFRSFYFHWFDFNIELNHWYNINIEQKTFNGKVIFL